jgi:hypothetical protein
VTQFANLQFSVISVPGSPLGAYIAGINNSGEIVYENPATGKFDAFTDKLTANNQCRTGLYASSGAYPQAR